MFRHLLFLSVSTAVAIDVIKYHLIHNVDHSVSPCDNFFRHVCPSTLPESEYLVNKTETLLYKLLENGFTEAWNPKNLQVLNAMQDFEDNFVGWDIENIIDEFYKKCIVGEVTSDWLELFGMSTSILQHDSDCLRAKQIFAIKFDKRSEHYKKTVAQLELDVDNSEILRVIQVLNALHLSTNGILRTSIDNIKKIVGESKQVLEEWIEDSPWVISHNVTDIYFKAVDDLHTISKYEDAFVPILNILTTIEQTYVDCIVRTQTTSFEGKLLCYLRAKEQKDNLMSVARADYPYFFPIIFFFFSPNDYFEWNAFNSHPSVGFNYPMQLYAVSDIPAILYGSAGTIVSHEVSHSLIKSGRSDDPLKGYFFSNETENCIENQLRKSCEIFDERNITEDGACTFSPSNKDVPSFDDDGADLLGGKVAYELAKRQYGDKFYEKNDIFRKLTNQQLFFYSQSAGMCWRQYSSYNGHSHSADYMRVNSMLAQNPDFREAFQCKDDSRMVQSATEQCEIFGQFAPLNKLAR